MVNPSINEREPRLERLQLIALAALMLIGAMFVYSAMQASTSASLPWYSQNWVRQIVWYVLGIGVATALCVVDYHTIARWSLVIYWGMILCLVAVLIPKIGVIHYGARRWIDLPFYEFQPSEFAKLAFILAAANFLSRPVDELRQLKNFGLGLGMITLPFLLIMREPDMGSALVLVPTGLVMMFVAGTPHRFLITLVAGVGIVGALLVVDVMFAPKALRLPVLKDYQRERLLVYFGMNFEDANATPEQKAKAREMQRTSSYQGKQSLISVGSGGFWGAGWCNGKQTSLQFMPPGAAHNDFIFSVIAEEEGFVGSLVVLTLYAVVLFTGLRIAGQARDRLGKLVAVGVVTLLFSHVFINIGMNIRIVPVTGIPLPLLSYGGSSVLCSLIALGLMQNVHIHRRGY
jgi:rod shape determining protein RodA